MVQEGFPTASQGRFTAEDAAAGTRATWMDPSPPRLHPRQRVTGGEPAAASGSTTAQRAQQALLHVSEPAVDDREDPLTRGLPPPAAQDGGWVAAYRRASDKRLPKPLRVLGWQVLHAALTEGASRVHAVRNIPELLQCCCRQPQCWPQQLPLPQPTAGQQQPSQDQHQQGQQPQRQLQREQQQVVQAMCQLETLSHMFVTCTSIRGAWDWFSRTWDRVQPGAGVNCSDVRVLLLDDGSVWQPPVELRHLWTHLRLLMLESIWVVRCAAEGCAYSSAQVVSRFLAALQQQLKQDWARTQGDIRANSGVPLSWLRGRSPDMPSGKFVAKWRGDGVLYTVDDDGAIRLCLSRGSVL